MEFFEPEDRYEKGKDLKHNKKAKVSALSIFLVLSTFLIVSIQKDFINFFAEGKIKETCLYTNTFTRIDDSEAEIEKIRQALFDHEDIFQEMKGYQGGEIRKNASQDQEGRKYSIYLSFEKSSLDIKRVPEVLCGHKVIIENK